MPPSPPSVPEAWTTIAKDGSSARESARGTRPTAARHGTASREHRCTTTTIAAGADADAAAAPGPRPVSSFSRQRSFSRSVLDVVGGVANGTRDVVGGVASGSIAVASTTISGVQSVSSASIQFTQEVGSGAVRLLFPEEGYTGFGNPPPPPPPTSSQQQRENEGVTTSDEAHPESGGRRTTSSNEKKRHTMRRSSSEASPSSFSGLGNALCVQSRKSPASSSGYTRYTDEPKGDWDAAQGRAAAEAAAKRRPTRIPSFGRSNKVGVEASTSTVQQQQHKWLEKQLLASSRSSASLSSPPRERQEPPPPPAPPLAQPRRKSFLGSVGDLLMSPVRPLFEGR